MKDLLAVYHVKVPTPSYIVLPSRRNLHPAVAEVAHLDPSGRQFVDDLFAPFKRGSGGTTSLTGAPTEPDSEPPLMRYGISSKPRSGLANEYNLIEIPISARSDQESTKAIKTPPRKLSKRGGNALMSPDIEITEPPPVLSRAKMESFPRDQVNSLHPVKTTTGP